SDYLLPTTYHLSYFANISNSSLSSSFTFTVPPAMEIGLMPKALCFKLAAPRQCPLAISWTLASIGRVWPRNVRSPAARRSAGANGDGRARGIQWPRWGKTGTAARTTHKYEVRSTRDEMFILSLRQSYCVLRQSS